MVETLSRVPSFLDRSVNETISNKCVANVCSYHGWGVPVRCSVCFNSDLPCKGDWLRRVTAISFSSNKAHAKRQSQERFRVEESHTLSCAVWRLLSINTEQLTATRTGLGLDRECFLSVIYYPTNHILMQQLTIFTVDIAMHNTLQRSYLAQHSTTHYTAHSDIHCHTE